MGNDEKSISGIPISGALAIVALILGLLVIPQEPFKASRPNTPEEIRSALHEGEDVQSRLWQDPFSAVMTHKRNLAPGLYGHSITDLANQIISKNGKKIVVLGVMAGSGPYAENIEDRIKYRYAVLSALSEEGYVPEDSEHIGYLENLSFNLYKPVKRLKGSVLETFYKAIDVEPNEFQLMAFMPQLWFRLKEHISPQVLFFWINDGRFYGKPNEWWFLGNTPYEWFESENPSSPPVLLLWLNDENFSGNPLRKLSDFTGLLNEAVTVRAEATQKEIPGLKYRILGPANSTNLRDIIKENDLNGDHKENLKNVQVFSWAATLDSEKLLSGKAHKQRYPLKTAIEKKCMIPGGQGLKFFRTIGPDKILADLLVKELSLRINGMIPQKIGETSKVHMALISEWDTVYGRSLPDAFIRSVAEKNNLKA